MRKLLLVAAGAGCLAALWAGIALATHPTVDPATVPNGLLVGHNNVAQVPKAALVRAVRDGADIWMQKATLAPGGSSLWHTHPGIGFIVMVSGELTLYQPGGRTCSREVFGAGTTFVDPGFGNVHLARNEGTAPAVFYTFFLLAPGSQAVRTPPPGQSLPVPKQCTAIG
jgi:hypothetical protein